jgi:hypothetical protein
MRQKLVRGVAICALAVVTMLSGTAYADNVQNDVVANVDGDKVVSLVAGDPTSTATVGFFVHALSGADPESGCNVDAGESITFSVITPTGVTATPSSLQFTTCGDTKSAVFKAASGASGGEVTLSITANSTGGGAYNLNTAKFQIDVTEPANTAPTVTVTGVSDGATYEYDAVPAAGCSVVDAEDGNSNFAADLSLITGPLSAYGIGSQTASCSYTDGGGLTDTDSATYSIVDTTDPTASITTPVAGAVYLLNQVVNADYSCDDGTGSGVASCVGNVADGAAIDTSSVGSKTFTVDATDNAGNTGQATSSYSVVYDFSGFFAPVDALPTLNSVKAGSAVPVKFSLAGDQGLNVMFAGYPASTTVACGTTAVDSIEQTAAAGSSSLSYDAFTDRYNYVWKTDKAWAGTCRTLTVKLADGTLHQANFKLTK